MLQGRPRPIDRKHATSGYRLRELLRVRHRHLLVVASFLATKGHMATQDVIKGFANPINPEQNVALIGRPDGYLLIVDGWNKSADSDLVVASISLREALKTSGADRSWREIREMRTPKIPSSAAKVEKLGDFTYGQYLESNSRANLGATR
jgi:hypothetical protein